MPDSFTPQGAAGAQRAQQQQPRESLDELRSQADLVSTVERHTTLNPVSFDHSWRGICPLHAGATNPTSFHIFPGGTHFRCYGCGAEGDVFAFIAALHGLTYAGAIRHWRLDSVQQLGRGAPLPSRRPPPRQAALPPRQAEALRYHEQLHQRSSLGVTGWDWWKQQGLSAPTISRFQVGYARQCPTLPDTDSFTLPIAYRGELFNIRHRLAQPVANAHGKYRPQRKGLGAHLFNADSLDVARPDDVLIVGGEKKAMVLVDLGIESIMPVVSSTGGESSWTRGVDGSELVSRWYDMLLEFRRVFVLFDHEPAMIPVAQRTARIFGRRGRVLWTPGKVDDYVLGRTEGLSNLMGLLANATPVMQQR